MNMIQAINSAMDIMLERDNNTVVFGEDVGYFGGVFRCTAGLQKKYGKHRVFDTPIAEGGILATAVGMGVYGLRPVVEIQFADYIYPAFDQLVSEAARLRYRSGGEFPAKMVIRTPVGGGIRGGHYHSQSPEAYFIHTPGLKVVVPSEAADVKGLMKAAIRDDDPVMFFQHKRLFRREGHVPSDPEFVIPLGRAATLVVLGKRQLSERISVQLFARQHGLTPAEMRVLNGLCEGLDPRAVAEQHQVGLATVRTQVASIRAKTGAENIRDLVCQVAVLPPIVSSLRHA